MGREPQLLAIIAALIAGTPPTAAAQECRTVCFPDEAPNAQGCCRPAEANQLFKVPDATQQVCQRGQVRVEGTSYCCWPNQVWGGNRCRGIPSQCPTGFRADEPSESCVLRTCGTGRVRAGDGITCCWPGQVVSGGTCRGVPSSCPPNQERVAEDCSDEAYQQAQKARALAAERAREIELQSAQAEEAAEGRVNDLRERVRDFQFRLGMVPSVGYLQLQVEGNPYEGAAHGMLSSALLGMEKRWALMRDPEDQSPSLGVEFAAEAEFHVALFEDTIMNLVLRGLTRVRFDTVAALAFLQRDHFWVRVAAPDFDHEDYRTDFSGLSAGIGLSLSDWGEKSSSGWSLEARWAPGLDLGTKNNVALQAELLGGDYTLGVLLRYQAQLGPSREVLLVGIYVGMDLDL